MGSEFDYTFEERDRDVNAGLYQRFFLENPAGEAEFTIGVEAANKIIVALQLQDIGGVALEETLGIEVFVASDALGTVAAADAFAVESGLGQELAVLTAASVLSVLSEADGTLSLGITKSGAASLWLGIKFPGGRAILSEEIVFAA